MEEILMVFKRFPDDEPQATKVLMYFVLCVNPSLLRLTKIKLLVKSRAQEEIKIRFSHSIWLLMRQ